MKKIIKPESITQTVRPDGSVCLSVATVGNKDDLELELTAAQWRKMADDARWFMGQTEQLPVVAP
jgi:hypothetical protein